MIKKVQQWFPLIILVASIAVAVMAFFPGLVKGDDSLTGLKAVFGGFGNTSFGGMTTSKDSGFVFTNFIAYFGPVVVAIIVFVLGLLDKNQGMVKMVLAFLTAVVFILAFIFIVMLPDNTYVDVAIIGRQTLGKAGFGLAWGSIIALIFAVVGSIVSLLYAVMQVMKKG